VKQKERDVRFDGLRVIGLLAIILAHVNPPGLLFQLRNFDVPLMVLISGSVYALSSGIKKGYPKYIWDRILRLILPTWVFLTFFFLFFWLQGHAFTNKTILESYALLEGIGYVWIIRVFILVALILPLFFYLYKKFSGAAYLTSLLIIFAVYTSVRALFLGVNLSSPLQFILGDIIFYTLPFGCVAGLGLYLINAPGKIILGLTGAFSALCLFLAYRYNFGPTQIDKYPPGAYYLSYALAVSMLLYLFSQTSVFQKIFGSKIMLFISASSIWIYLWQVLFLFLWRYAGGFLHISNFLAEYGIIVWFSVMVTYIQKYIFGKVISLTDNRTVAKYLTISFMK
jgi:peptidoglycan/LPS O-acetylase OafA/YrhL